MHPIKQSIIRTLWSILLGDVLAVVNQIHMRNVSGFANTPSCAQQCLYCCYDVAFQSGCYTNECFCLASQLSNRLDYVEYCVSVQCNGNNTAVIEATSIVNSYCLSSLWTSIYPVLTDAAATSPTGPIQITVPTGFVWEPPLSATSAGILPATTSQANSPTQSFTDADTSTAVSNPSSTSAGAGGSETDFNFTTTFNGRPLLTGTCATPTFTPIPDSLISPYLWFPFIGCLEESLNCCPFAGSPEGIPYVDLPSSSQALGRCPQDYSTVGSNCCPSGFSMYDLAVPTGGPTPCFSSLESPLRFPTPTTGDSSYTPAITNEVFALSLPLQSHRGLSTGSKAGIGVGVGVGSIAILSAILFWWRVHYKSSKIQPPEVVAPASGNKHELDGHQVSEAPANYSHFTSGHVSPANLHEHQLINESELDGQPVSEAQDSYGHFAGGHTAPTVVQERQFSELSGDPRA